jgi:hypothetical protein
MAVVIMGGGGKDAIVASTINCRHHRHNTTIDSIGSIPLPPPLMMTAITAIEDRHCRCYTVDNDDCQKPAVVVRHQWRQWR